MSTLRLHSPSLVLLLWAVLFSAGADTYAMRLAGAAALTVTLTIAELERTHRGGNHR